MVRQFLLACGVAVGIAMGTGDARAQVPSPPSGGDTSLPSLRNELRDASRAVDLNRLYESLSQGEREELLRRVEALQITIPIEIQRPIGPVPPKPPRTPTVPPPPPPRRNPRLSEWSAEFRELRDVIERAEATKDPTLNLSDETTAELARIIQSLKTGKSDPQD